MIIALRIWLSPGSQGAVVLGPGQQARDIVGTLLAMEGIEERFSLSVNFVINNVGVGKIPGIRADRENNSQMRCRQSDTCCILEFLWLPESPEI
jgi:hypothetical protein